MYKAVVLIKRKRGMSMEDFIDYYENKHIPLALPRVTNLKRDVRHYIRPFGNDVYQTDAESPYDVLTEIGFENEMEFLRGMAMLAEPETAAILAADEEKLFERPSIRFMRMEDRESNLPGAQGGMYKAVVLIKKKRGMSMEDFVEYYETKHAPLGLSKVTNLKRYVRHYIRPFGNDVYPADAASPYDVLTEIGFENEMEFLRGMAMLTEPETAAIIAADEEYLFERSSIRFMVMEDRETDFSQAFLQ